MAISISKDQLTEAGLILGAGAIGGFLSWVWAATLGKPLAGSPWLMIPASMVLGMGAAFLGVYLLANSDTRALMRCLAFAIACGFSWKPVYDAGDALVSQRTREQQEGTAKDLSKKAETAIRRVEKAQPSEVAPRISEAADAALEAARAAQKVDDPSVRSEVSLNVTKLLAVAQKAQEGVENKLPADVGMKVKMLEREHNTLDPGAQDMRWFYATASLPKPPPA